MSLSSLFEPALLLQPAVNALAAGALFSLYGLSFGLIYSTTQILHFAHGAVFVFAVYVFLAVYVLLGGPLVAAAAASVGAAGLLGSAMMRFFYQPMINRGTSGAVVMIASLGLFIVVENLIVLVFGNDSRVVSKGAVQEGLQFGDVYVTQLQIVTFATAIVTFGVVFFLLRYSKLGRALVGIADDPKVAAIVGIDVTALRYVVFAIGSMVLAVGGILSGLDVGASPGMGLPVVLIATIAAIIGGAGRLFSGVAGGFLVGAIQSFGVVFIDPRWQNLLIFAALIGTLLVRPSGIFRPAR
jgi:branched-chain amino acid transport system permease protein